jgi:hypothetical protein
MRTSLRAAIAISLSLGAVIVASVTSASTSVPETTLPAATFMPPTAGTGSGSGGGVSVSTCTIVNPNCNDRAFGGGDLTVCGVEPATPEPTPIAPDSPVGSCITDPTGGPATIPSSVVPTPGLANVRPTAFDAATIGADDVTLTITYWSGVAPCDMLDHVDVVYGAGAVTVTLFRGSDPTMDGVACPDIAMLAQTTITLDQPLAGRTIVDGTTA